MKFGVQSPLESKVEEFTTTLGTTLSVDQQVAALLEVKLGGYERARLRTSEAFVSKFEDLGIKVLGKKLFPDIDYARMILPSKEQLEFAESLSTKELEQIILVAVPAKMNARNLAISNPAHALNDSDCDKIQHDRISGHYEMLVGKGAEKSGSRGLSELDQIKLLSDGEFTASPESILIADLEGRFIRDGLRVPTASAPSLALGYYSDGSYVYEFGPREHYHHLALAVSRE